MGAIESCRSATLGGHIEQCNDCGQLRIAYNSCRNRHCPKCQGLARAQWLADRQSELLPVPYFHVVFTVPAPIAEIALHNKAVVYGILFTAAGKAIAMLDPDRYVAEDSTEDVELAILDENKHTLSARVARLDTGMAWAEDPPSRTRHLLANIEIEPGDAGSELEVRCNFVVYRSRSETEQDFYVGARRDVLRSADGAWKIARQKLILDQNVLLAKNVSIFF